MQTKDPLRHVLHGLASSNSIRTHRSKFRTWLFGSCQNSLPPSPGI